ncbi:MAG TPA: M23 family metallopeptidase [bacterium]|jgi:murein DD-endopeptidase MepM/ murein hydrolase activator NlpD
MSHLAVRLQVQNRLGETRVLAVPRPLVASFAALLPLCLLLAPVSIWLGKDRGRLAAQVQEVEEAYSGAHYLFGQLTERLSEIHELNNRLRIVADDSPPSINGQFFGVGGLQAVEREEISLPERLRGLAEEIRRTETNLTAEDASFAELTHLLEQRQQEMLVTPSIWPTHGWVASPFGRRIDPYTHGWKRHAGVDIAGRYGTPVVASASGAIDQVSLDSSFGHHVVIDHGLDTETLYAHLETVIVVTGDKVHRGDVIGYLGSSGRSTGPHLHYEVHRHGIPRDPMDYIRE